MNLQIGNGLNLFSINYSCTNGTNSFSGTINIGDAQSIEQVVGNIPDGSGYTCTLTGSDSAGDFCSGTTTSFSISSAQVSYATTVIKCTVATDSATASTVDTGSVFLDAGVTVSGQAAFVCPAITSFSISPAEILPPQTSALAGAATSFSGGTETITWSTSCAGANITNPNSLNATFACGSSTGNCNVTLTVGLIGTSPDGGSAGQVCTGVAGTAMTSTINCETGGALQCFAPTDTVCTTDAGSTCVNTHNAPVDPANCGGCGVTCTSPQVCTHNASTNTNSCVTPPPSICTTAGQTNCVSCPNNQHTGTCTKTEADMVQLDLNAGRITAAGPDNVAGSCYQCLSAAFCLDGSVTSGAECDDVAGNFTNGSAASVPFTGTCLSTLECVIGSAAGTGSNGLGSECSFPVSADAGAIGDHGFGESFCYCGTNGGASSTCGGVTNQNGACLNQELAGFNTTTASTILNNFTNTAEPSGMAMNLVACALANNCTMCLNQ
jgi:hypothetical protein